MIKDRATEFGQRGWTQFRAFTPGQQLVTLFAVVALIIGGVLFARWTPATPYAPLYTNLAPADASSIIDKLNSAGIPYKLAGGGTEIDVPQSKVYATRITMSAAGLPGSGQTGYALLDKEGVTTSQFQQQIDYQRALEGELAKTIEAIGGVQGASVHLAIPQQDVFNDGSQKPSAAVLLTTSSATTLSASQVQSVVYLVSSSVPGMTTGRVSVSDSNGNVLAAPGTSSSGGVMNGGTQTQITQDYNNRIAASIQSLIDNSIGPGHATVTVNSLLNFNQTTTTSHSYLYNKNFPPVSETQTKETYTGTGANGGTLGTDTTTTLNGANKGKYLKTSKTVNNALGTNTQTVVTAPGQPISRSIAVLLDKSVKGLNVAAIKSLVTNGVGIKPAQGDTLSVQSMTFANTATNAANAASTSAAKAAASAASQTHLISLVKQGALVALVLLLVLGTWLRSRKRAKSRIPERMDDDILGFAYPEEPVPAVEERAAPQGRAHVADLQDVAGKRRTLTTAADTQPDNVARVLSGWLNTKES